MDVMLFADNSATRHSKWLKLFQAREMAQRTMMNEGAPNSNIALLGSLIISSCAWFSFKLIVTSFLQDLFWQENWGIIWKFDFFEWMRILYSCIHSFTNWLHQCAFPPIGTLTWNIKRCTDFVAQSLYAGGESSFGGTRLECLALDKEMI